MYHIIINPASRSGRGLKIWKNLIGPALEKEKVSYRSYLSQKAGDVVEIAGRIEAAESGDKESPVKVIVLGGDGTVNEMFHGLSDPARLLLGYIPTGSSNDLARDLKIPKDPLAALHLILENKKPAAMDLGQVTYIDGKTRYFLVSCGIGFDAAICEETNRSTLKNVLNRLGLGKLSYMGIGIKQLIAAEKTSCKMTLDEDAVIKIDRMLFICCMVHRFEGGGFMFAPPADAHDGILNLCAVGDLPKPLALAALPPAFFGKHYLFPGVTPHRARDITIESERPLWVHTDGEVKRKEHYIKVTCLQDAFRMML